MEPLSKIQLKNQKIQRKILDSENLKSNSSDLQIQGEQFIILDVQKIIKKSKKWWSVLDQYYFKGLSYRQTLSMRDQASNQKLREYFSTQSQIKGSYISQQLTQYFQLIKEKQLIHVLFKSSTPYFMFSTSYQISTSISQKSQNQSNQLPFKVVFMNQKDNYGNMPIQAQQEPKQSSYNVQNCQRPILQLVGFSQNEQFCLKMQKAQQIIRKHQKSSQIDLQIALWQNQLSQLNGLNSIYWNSIITSYKSQKPQVSIEETQIFQIKQKLMWNTILRYFQHGLADKTQKMLQILIQSQKLIKPAKSRQSNQVNLKKLFQTDCKICFCSFNSDSNQVLYCDQCNTSFHLACYGLHSIPQEKQYFCQCCQQMRKYNKKNQQPKKLSCQICCKQNFPMKCINGHFYHVTCLVLFGFIEINQGTLQLKKSLKHEDIIKMVVQNQLSHKECQFCTNSSGSWLGLQLKCAFEGCQEQMHPICAYINGCRLIVKKNQRKGALDVRIYCNKHDYQRDYIQQTYLRRYMCNFKHTSQKKFQQFKAQYSSQTTARQFKHQEKNKHINSLPSIMSKSKIVKRYILSRQQKSQHGQEQLGGTQSRKMLQKLYKKIS